MKIQSTFQCNYQNRNIGFEQNYLAKFVGAPCVEYRYICKRNKRAVVTQVLSELKERSSSDGIHFGLEVQHQGVKVLIVADLPTLEPLESMKTDTEKNAYLSQVAAAAEELIVSLTNVCKNCARRVRS